MSEMFRARPEEMAWTAIPARDSDADAIVLPGRPVATEWGEVALALLTSEHGKALREVDIPWCIDRAILIPGSRVDEMRSILGEFGEFLPVSIGKVRWWLFHPTTTRDALDVESSDVERADELLLYVHHYVFREDPGDPSVFVLGHGLEEPIYSSTVVEKLNQLNLSGLHFERLP